MRTARTTVALVFSALAVAAAQSDRGQIRGTLTGARGPIPNAEVRVRNTATEQVTVGTTSAAGSKAACRPRAEDAGRQAGPERRVVSGPGSRA